MSDELITPWRVCDELYLMSAKNIAIGFAESNAMAAAIVHRVNCHDKLVEALEHAWGFIQNGTEFGYIRMPDKDTPDCAKLTPGLIRAALELAKGGTHD